MQRTTLRKITVSLLLATLLLVAASAQAQTESTPPAAILVFEAQPHAIDGASDPQTMSLQAVEDGEWDATLRWQTVNIDPENHTLRLEVFRINGWEPLANSTPTDSNPLELNGEITTAVLHPLNFGEPGFRLVITGREDEIIDQRMVFLPFAQVEDDVQPIITSLTAPLTSSVADLDAIPVTWQVAQRRPNSHLVFEQVLSDGSSISAEHTRASLWVSSMGTGQLRAQPPQAGNAVILRLRVLDLISGEVYDEAGLVIGVSGEVTEAEAPPVPTQQTTGNAPRPNPTPTPAINTGGEPNPAYSSSFSTSAAFQRFQNGFMIWNETGGDIWVLANSGIAYFYQEAFYSGLPDNPVSQAAPTGTYKPISGFGRVWGNYSNVREMLGWAVSPEEAYTAQINLDGISTPALGSIIIYTLNLPNGRQIRVRNTGTWEFADAATTPQPGESARQIRSFSLSTSLAYPGDLITLYWDVLGADEVRIEIYELNEAGSMLAGPLAFVQEDADLKRLDYIIPDSINHGIRFMLYVGNDNIGPVMSRDIIFPGPEAVMEIQTQGAYQSFEGGMMLWRSDNNSIYVLLNSGQVMSFSISSYNTLPDNPVTDVAPAGRVKPISGFGRVWGNYPDVRAALGWGLSSEQGYTMIITSGDPARRPGEITFSLPDNRRVFIKPDFTWAYAG